MCFRPPAMSSIMVRCPKCQTFNKTGDKVCKKCGEAMPDPPPEEE